MAIHPNLSASSLFTYDRNGNLTALVAASSVPVLGHRGAAGSLSGDQGMVFVYRVNVPASARHFTVHTRGGTGDGDLFIRRGGLPTNEVFDLRSISGTNTETVSMRNVGANTYYVMVRGYAAFQGLRLELSEIEPFRPDVAIGKSSRSLKGANRYGSPSQQRYDFPRSGLRTVSGVAMLYNRGSVPEALIGRASGGSRQFAVSYFSSRSNVTAALRAARHRISPRSYGQSPAKVSIVVKPAKRFLFSKPTRRRRGGLMAKSYTVRVYAISDSSRDINDAAEIRVRTR